jgi:hypothetical protein
VRCQDNRYEKKKLQEGHWWTRFVRTREGHSADDAHADETVGDEYGQGRAMPVACPDADRKKNQSDHEHEVRQSDRYDPDEGLLVFRGVVICRADIRDIQRGDDAQ